MQGKRQDISPIKNRILQFVDTLGISKREFYAKIGVSRGTLESKTGITEDVMAKFIAEYDKVSLIWLLTGQGEMLKEEYPNDSYSNIVCEPPSEYQRSLKAENQFSVPYEFVQSIIKSNDALLEERKQYDMERRELLSQQAKLIDMLDNRLSALEKSNASAVSSVPIGNSATAGENEK